jgi:hypothetical protein
VNEPGENHVIRSLTSWGRMEENHRYEEMVKSNNNRGK